MGLKWKMLTTKCTWYTFTVLDRLVLGKLEDEVLIALVQERVIVALLVLGNNPDIILFSCLDSSFLSNSHPATDDVTKDGVIVAIPEEGAIVALSEDGGVLVGLPEAGVIVVLLQEGVVVELPAAGIFIELPAAGVIAVLLVTGVIIVHLVAVHVVHHLLGCTSVSIVVVPGSAHARPSAQHF